MLPRFVVNLKGNKGVSLSMGSCTTNSSGRCSWVDVNAGTCIADTVLQDYCVQKAVSLTAAKHRQLRVSDRFADAC